MSSSEFGVNAAAVDDLSTWSTSAARRRPRPTSVSATVVRLLWLQTVTQAFVGGGLTDAASSNSGSTSSSSSSSSSSCPKACFCNAPSRIVYCSRRGLNAVPDGIAANSLQLNLNGNVFASSTLRRGNFSGLASLDWMQEDEESICNVGI